MNFEIEASEGFRRAAKSLAKKHPSFKKDLTEFLKNLAATLQVVHRSVKACIRLGCLYQAKVKGNLEERE